MSHKIVWSEGMFLRPHHFQHNDQYLESMVEQRCLSISRQAWGFHRFQVDQKILQLGKVGLDYAQGVFQDGFCFSTPTESALPEPIDIGTNVKDCIVYLVLPLLRSGSSLVSNENSKEITRYISEEKEIFDVNAGASTSEMVDVVKPRIRLALETEDLSGYTKLAIANIIEVKESGGVVLQNDFIAPVTSCQNNHQIKSLLLEIKGLLAQRGDAISGRFNQSMQGGAAAITDFLMLQTINKNEPLFNHIVNSTATHPEELYKLMLALIGDLSTFCSTNKRVPIDQLPNYQHTKLTETFLGLRRILNQYLSSVMEQSATSYDMEERPYGVRVARINNRSDLENPKFVLAVNADVPAEEIRQRLPSQIKIGSVEKIHELVNNQLAGITVTALPVAPRQIPFHAGYHYFQLDANSEYWQNLSNSAAFAFHLSGNYPSLSMEFWSIKG